MPARRPLGLSWEVDGGRRESTRWVPCPRIQTAAAGERHLGVNLPLVLLGGGAGKLKGGRHLRYPGDTSNADLLMTLMDKLDLPLDRLGDSTTKLPIDTLSEV